MSVPPPHNISPPPGFGGTDQQSTGVRRVHTITAASRSARTGSRLAISEENQDQQPWQDEEVVDQEWVGGVGAVGEPKGSSSLHRQASLPTRYNRGTSLVYQNLPVLFAVSFISVSLTIVTKLMAMRRAQPVIILLVG